MARPKLRSPDQPFAVQFILGIYEFCASLKLAVILILSIAFALGYATFVESKYGTRAVHFGIYGTWWFGVLLALLALCIFCAAMIRYPWKRHQTGFVITHLGLLTLLFGCYLHRRGGIDAQMLIFEGGTGHIAYEDAEHFELAIHRRPNTSDPHVAERGDLAQVSRIHFVGGPFNWQDYDRLPWFPWRARSRDQGVIYDQGGVRLEVLDYYANSEAVDAPQVKLEISTPPMGRPHSQENDAEPQWSPLTLSVRPSRDPHMAGHPYGLGRSQQMGGGQIAFWMTGDEGETNAFLDSQPEGPAGGKGQIVLHAQGEKLHLVVDEKLGQGRFPLGESGLEAEIVEQFDLPQESEPNRPVVELRIYADGDDAGERMVLFAGMPELNRQNHEHGVFGSYWVVRDDVKSEDLVRGQGGSRIDVIQGHDQKLYYRYWNRREIVAAGPLPEDGTPVDAFKMPIGQLKLRVADHIAADSPQVVVLPLPFDKSAMAVDSLRAAKVRLTVDGNTEEFWIVGPPPDVLQRPMSPLQRRVVEGDKRLVALTMPLDEIDVGFRIRLQREGFERKLDPGTSQPAHYGSVVDFVDHRDDSHVLRRDVRISMNAPVDFTDPQSGRSYRLFQEAFRGPFAVDSPIHQRYRELVKDAKMSPAFISILTVNYDPGRGIKYVGCLLVVAGIATMFYMRAYFFKPQGRAESKRAKEPERAQKHGKKKDVDLVVQN